MSDQPQVMMVQGRQVDSLNEYNFAIALDYYKLPYTYQYAIDGGKIRGGQMIDFLVGTPMPTPVQIGTESDYWHKAGKGADDFFKDAEVDRLGEKWGWSKLLKVTYPQTNTIEAARVTVRQKFIG